MNGELDKLIQFTAEHFVFDENAYPELAGVTDEEKLKFALRHSALHFAKTAGKIAALVEGMDHGKKLDTEEIKANIPKELINTLRLAELVDMTEADIIRAIEEKYNDRLN